MTVAKVILILDANLQLLNIDKPMNAVQVKACADEIVKECWRLKLDDIDLCMRRGVRGEYGEIYNRMDQSVIFKWIRQYQSERDEHIAKSRDNAEARGENNIYEVFNNPVMEKILGEVSAKFEERMNAEPVVFKHRELTPAEQQMRDLANEYFQEFDEIYAAMPNKPMGERMILVGTDEGETWMTAQEYVNFKLSK